MRWLLFALVFFARTAGLFAADAQKQEIPEARDTVIVPYDSKKPVKDQHPDKVYLKYDRFLELWEAAKKNRAGEKAPMAAAAFALGSARYEGRVEEKRAAFTATIEVSTFDEQWVRVPMAFTGVQLRELSLDGKPAAFAEGALVVEKPGKHVLAAKFEIPLASGVSEFAWGVPQTAATRLSLTLPETRWTARIQPDAGVIERMVNGEKVVTAALGTTADIRVNLVQAEAAARLVEPAVAEITNAFSVSPAFERAVAEIAFSFPGAQQDTFAVRIFPRDAVLAGIEAPGLKSWNLREKDGAQLLEVTLAEPAKEQFKLTVTTERLQAQQFPSERSALWFGAGAKRAEQVLEFYSGGGVEVQPMPSANLRRTERGLKVSGEWTPIGSWKGDEALKYRVSLVQPKHEARVDYVYQVNRRKIELIASLQLHAKDAPLFDASLTLPAGFDVQTVDSERLQDWWRDGQKLRVRFKGATPEMTPLVVYLFREYAAAPQQIDVQPLALNGFAKVTGEAVVAAHKGVDATLKLAANGDAESAKEVDPAKAAPDFQILPPLERKRGFAFKNQSFSGKVALAALPVKQNATWVMHAQAHEAWLSLSLKVQLSLRQGSIERTSFSLPASLPEAHVSGGEVRETRSRVEGGRRIYEVAFQNDVYDTVDLTMDVDVAMADGKRPDGRKANEFALPAPAFPEALLVTGYVLADNASEYELKLETDGVEPAPTTQIPWLPSLTKGAGFFRVQPVWKVAVVMERLEKAETRSAFCAWAEMTTALRNDGTEWHKAVWHLQNRSLQFLPVKLPDGAVLVGARVAGQNVRADTGTVNGRALILVPLIKTKPGDVSYDVEVVWRREGEQLFSRGQRKFSGAELPGITVEETFWSVWLPEDRRLSKSDGNMEEVIEVLREVEKARSAVEELKLLNGILSDQSVSAETWANAKRNFDFRCMVLQKQVDTNNGALQDGRYAVKAADNGLGKQGQALIEKAITSNTYIGSELAQVAADNKRIEQRRAGQAIINGANTAQTAAQNRDGQMQIANNANAAQALLFGNNTYTGNTTLNGGTLNNAGASNTINSLTISGVNTSQSNSSASAIVNNGAVQPDNSGTQNFNNGSQIFRSARWNANPDANSTMQTQTEDAGLPANSADTRNFYLNDNVVLQQAKAKKQAAEPTVTTASALTKSGSGTLALSSKLGSADDLSFSTIKPSKAPNESSAEKNKEQMQNADQGRGLNIARGNRQQQMEQAQYGNLANAGQQLQPNQPASAAMPVAAPGVVPPMAQTAPVTSPPANAPVPAPGPAAGGMTTLAAGGFLSAATAQAPGIVQPLGRLSLAVDFPTEGRVHHFQKVKANAVLELSFVDPKLEQRWMRTAIFAGIALMLWLLGRFSAVRRRE